MTKIKKIKNMAKPQFHKSRPHRSMPIPEEFEDLIDETDKWFQEVRLLYIFSLNTCQFN